jgi:hypothetical protein
MAQVMSLHSASSGNNLSTLVLLAQNDDFNGMHAGLVWRAPSSKQVRCNRSRSLCR